MREHVAGRSALLHLVRASPDVAPGSRIGPSSGRRGYMQAPCGMVQAESNLIGEKLCGEASAGADRAVCRHAD